jgi:hypothetical protein
MSEPVLIICPQNQWTKVANSVKIGKLWNLNITTHYLMTNREIGGSIPTAINEGVRIFTNPKVYHYLDFNSEKDVYLYALNQSGKIRLDSLVLEASLWLDPEAWVDAEDWID